MVDRKNCPLSAANVNNVNVNKVTMLNFQYRGVLLIWIRVGQGPTALAVGAGGDCLDIFSLVYHLISFSLSQGDGPI